RQQVGAIAHPAQHMVALLHAGRGKGGSVQTHLSQRFAIAPGRAGPELDEAPIRICPGLALEHVAQHARVAPGHVRGICQILANRHQPRSSKASL
ncbi:hypothetical protein, partial [Cupriavidus sp. 2MCAB6]|uniref:hypothetical protein n=1 Tax=Cupriavidus sp. 2MCAB6 TaxID=3232981 RepID=UPI003F91B210